jgi:UDP-N-acetylglucosamine 4-epimerase
MNVLVTGGAGFIGSNLVAKLIEDGDVSEVRVVDNLMTGFEENLKPFLNQSKFQFIKGDITDKSLCEEVMKGITHVSHQAAVGSVPRSISDPWLSHDNNINGTLNILLSAREVQVKRVVFASSSSVYGDDPHIPKTEPTVGKVLSPYALTKRTKEEYGRLFSEFYNMSIVGLRYFNVFGPNQSPKGPYAAVIPLFIASLLKDQAATIHGDGHQSRDFTYIDNVVHANILALKKDHINNNFQVFNAALGGKCSVKELYEKLAQIIGCDKPAQHINSRKGDIKHSLADITHIQQELGFTPLVSMDEGLKRTVQWFKNKHG